LEDKKARDFGQVVSKWANDVTDKLKSRVKVKHGVEVPRDAQLQTLPSIGTNLNMDEDGLKVLMVGQPWCWIIYEGKFCMCFLSHTVTEGNFLCSWFERSRKNCDLL
jgi:hypothetical protein